MVYLFRNIKTKDSIKITNASNVEEAWDNLEVLVTDIDNWEYQGVV
jgi:hypothetical protein